MQFLDLFAGIGGFRLGMEMAGHDCVGFVEWDKYARKSYEAIHDTDGEWTGHDITKITDDEWREFRGKVDVICAGFPCQSFSVGGRRGGFDDIRGTMFFEVARAAQQIKPRILFIENVKGLLSHDKGNTFGIILNTLDELGYDCEWEVCNSKTHVPQNRERVFLVGHLRGSCGRKVFPLGGDTKETDIEIDTNADHVPKQIIVKGNLNIDGHESMKRVYGVDGLSPTVTAKQGGGHEPKIAIPVSTPTYIEKDQNGRRFKEDGEPMFTLTAKDRHGVMIREANPNDDIEIYDFSQSKREGKPRVYTGYAPTLNARDYKEPRCVKVREATKTGYAVAHEGDSINLTAVSSKTRRGRVGKGVANTIDTSMNQGTLTNFRIRRLTPRECFKLQGFPEWSFERAQAVNSDSQLYKQAGNTVTVPLIYEIAKRLV